MGDNRGQSLALPARSHKLPLVIASRRHGWAFARRAWSTFRPVVFLVPVTQLLVLLWAIWFHTPNLPWSDEWFLVKIVAHANQGALTFQDLWALHNDSHRLVLTRLLDLGMIELTHWNRQIELTVDLGLAVVSAFLILSCVRQTFASWNATLVLVVPLSLLLFSFGPAADWLFPFQVQFITTILGVAMCMRALIAQPVRWRGFTLAMLGALIATLSSAAGLVAWVAFIPSIWRMGYRWLAAWVGCGLAIGTAYMIGVPHQPRPSIRAAIKFAFAFLGAPLGYPHGGLSLLLGLVGILLLLGNLYLYWRVRKELWSAIIWIELVLYSLGTAAMAAWSRANMGIGPLGALHSRYQIFPLTFWAALTVIVARVIQELAGQIDLASVFGAPRALAGSRAALLRRGIVGANALTLLGICALSLAGGLSAFAEGLAWDDTLMSHESCIIHYQNAPESCLHLWFSFRFERETLGYIQYIQHHHLAAFYTASASVSSQSSGVVPARLINAEQRHNATACSRIACAITRRPALGSANGDHARLVACLSSPASISRGSPSTECFV
jgi:hypothetical protein